MEVESVFSWCGAATEVYILGNFTNWEPTRVADRTSHGHLAISFKLSPGVYSYIFQVDGEWRNDPNNKLDLNEDGYNQLEVLLPELPHYLPHSIQGEPVAHLFLKFNPSVMSLVEQCILTNGCNKYLVSVIIIEPEVASACAILVPEYIKSEACETLNGADIKEGFTLEALPFKLPSRSLDMTTQSTAAGIFKVSISPQLPGYVIKKHIEEHFQILKPVGIELSTDGYWKISFTSFSSAKEAVAAFNNSLFMDKIIRVSFEEDTNEPNLFAVKASDDRFIDEAEAIHTVPVSNVSNREVCNVFVYSNPKFPNFVEHKDLMEHFEKFSPVNAFVITKNGRSTGTAKVSFPSRVIADRAIKAMKGTKILDCYAISLKFEDPSHPPKSKPREYKDEKKWLSTPSSPSLSQTEGSLTQSVMEQGQYSSAKEDDTHDPTRKIKKGSGDRIQHKQLPEKGMPPAPSLTREKQSTPLPCRTSKSSTLASKPGPVVSSSHLPLTSKSATPVYKPEMVVSSSLKVSHLPLSVTIAKLIGLFERFGKLDGNPVIHKGHTPYAHVNFQTSKAAEDALHALNNTKFEGARITIKSVKSLHRITKGTPSSEPETASQGTIKCVMRLLPEQWNQLMFIGPTKTTMLEDMMAPYSCSVDVQPVFDKKVLQFTGKEETVQSAVDYLTAQLKKEHDIGRMEMEAMVFLLPSLPSEIKQKFGVTVEGYCRDSRKITLDGPIDTIAKAYENIHSQLSLLIKDEVNLKYGYPSEELETAQSELENDGIYLSPEPSSNKTVNLYHFRQLDMAVVRRRVASLLHSVKTTISCKPREVIFLQLWLPDNGKILQQLERVSFGQDVVTLKGTPPLVESAKKMIKSVLAEINCKRVSLSAISPEVESHIKKSILGPFQKEDPTFRYFLATHTNLTDVYIFSANPEIYAESCRLLDQLDPTTKDYPLPENAGKVVAEMQSDLEGKYLVRLASTTSSSSVTIHGLITSKLDQCYEELKNKIESTLPSTKLLPITDTQNQLLRQFYKKDLNGLRSSCSSLSITNDNHLKIMGTIKEVDDVVAKLNSGLLSLHVSSESFQVRCKPQEHKMWQRWWQHLKEREKESKVLISFNSVKSTPSDVIFDFKVLGITKNVNEVKAMVTAKEVEVNVLSLPRKALKPLLKSTKKVSKLNSLIVHLSIDEWKKEVTIFAPKECAHDLEAAVEEVHALVGSYIEQNEFIVVHDPVVRQILKSEPLSAPYIAKAQAETSNVTLSVLREPVVRLQVTGLMSSLEIAKPVIHKLTIDAIEKSIDLKLVSVKPICVPLLTSPEFTLEFSKLQLMLKDECCVTCFLRENTNQLLYCGSRGNSIQIEVTKGDILLEHVDAIVNAANENLRHDGGLARAISIAGGPDIQSECDAYITANSRIEPGQAVCLGPGCLPFKHIIHTVGPRWKRGNDGEWEVLCSAVNESLKLAHHAGLTSIAIPALGAGIFKVPANICVQASIKGVDKFASNHPDTPLHLVKFVLLDPDVADVFLNAFKKLDQPPIAGISIAKDGVLSAPAEAISTLTEGVLTSISVSTESMGKSAEGTSLPIEGTSTPAADRSTPAEGISLATEVTFTPAEDSSTPAEGTSKSAEGTSMPAEGTSTPAEGSISKPAEGISAPAEGISKLAEGISKLAEGISKPAEGISKPAEGISKLAEGISKPAEGISKPAEGISKLAEGISKPAEGISKLAEGISKLAKGISKPAEGISAPAAGTSASAEDHSMSAKGTSMSISTVTEAVSSVSNISPAYLWEWLDDRRKNMPYTAEVNHQLNSAYRDNPLGSCVIFINSTRYRVDFSTMKQTNELTRYKREVMKRHQPTSVFQFQHPHANVQRAGRVRPVDTESVRWQYRNDKRVLTSYSSQDSKSIERLYQCDAKGGVRINGNMYAFDFSRMKQINTRTKYEREIRRACISVSATVPTKSDARATKKSMVVLRGPREHLPAAEKLILDKLKGCVIRDRLPLAVTVMTEELREAISQTAISNDVNYSFAKDGGTEDMMLEGSRTKVLEASKRIHEQLLLHEKLEREKDKSEHEKKVSSLLQNQASNALLHSTQCPPEWEEPGEQRVAVFLVSPGSQEWVHVRQKFYVTMSSHTIKSIKRIQNYPLWEKYSLSKKQLEQKYSGDANEMELFHGSRSNDPESIYGGEDAFDMRHCNGGMWGLANYFAEKACYSDRYRHSDNSVSRMFRFQSENQILLAKVLVGKTFESPPDKSLRMPPFKPGSRERYDSVSGHTCDSTVYMTYDNARAYPAYLITYNAPGPGYR